MSDTIGIWKKDPRAWITPGGDPVYYCPHCGEGLHVYGIEHLDNHMDKCPDCGKENKYSWEKMKERTNHENNQHSARLPGSPYDIDYFVEQRSRRI